MRRAWLLIGALLLAACDDPTTVTDVCEQLEAECDVDRVDCQNDGDDIQVDAESQGCEDGFQEYLDCADRAACDWADACADVRTKLETCLGAPIE